MGKAQINKAQRKNRGFTLIEMSIVLLIVGLVIVITYPALRVTRQSYQIATTQEHLQSLMRATAAFVQSNGCLPCPTKATASTAAFGRVRGDTTASLCGTCSQEEGLVPFVSLGVPASMAKDGWGRWITMRVDRALTTVTGIVPPTAPCTTNTPPCVQGQSRQGLCAASLANSTTYATVNTVGGTGQKAAVVFVSHGANGFGAYGRDLIGDIGEMTHPAFPDGATDCASGNYEQCNADDDEDGIFYQASYSTDPATLFDDVLLYLNRKSLITYLGNAACQSEGDY